MALGVLYLEWASDPTVRAVVTGVGATGAGLYMGTALKLGRAIARRPAALVLVAACFFAVGVGRFSMLLVLPISAAIGILFARRGWL
jgi:chromate transporter